MLHSLFKGRCKHCDEDFQVATGSVDVCNRCASVMSALRNLPISIIEKLLTAVAGPSWGNGEFKVTWQHESATAEKPRSRR